METHLEKKKGQLIYTVASGSEVSGYVVIDSMVAGRSCGGLRMLPDVDREEMSGLAKAMTLKYGFLGLPQGGAKAGVRGDPASPRSLRWRLLKDFTGAIEPLLKTRTYVPGADMGTDNADIRYMLRSIGFPIKRRELLDNHSGYYTARTVLAGIIQAAGHLALSLEGCTAAIEGFGKVGGPLAELLAAINAKVVAISTSQVAIYDPLGLDVKKLKELGDRDGSRVVETYRGAERLPRAALLELPVDLLCPCARHNSVHLDNAGKIKARVICPGANNPVTAAAERVLSERGVLCLPDFVTNCGGVLGGTMEFASVERSRIDAFIDQHVGKRIAWILKEADRRGVSPREIAEPVAMRRFQEVQEKALHFTVKGRLFSFMLELYRCGYIPGSFVATFSMPYFEKLLTRGF
jgi:glutamate dehydrogenase (NAD(P)+)